MSRRFWDWHAIISYNYKTKVLPYQERIEDIIKTLEIKGNHFILDAGCGTGYLIKIIKEKHPSAQIEAVDFSREMLNRAAKRCMGLKNINFREVDLDAHLPHKPNSFNAIACDNVLYAIPRPDFTLKEFFRVLKPKGRLIVVIPKPEIDSRAIIFHHFRGLKSPWQKIKAFFVMLITFLLIIPFEKSIDRKIKQGIYHALTGDEILTILDKIGFSEGKIGLTFADQNWIIYARKP
ncbi:MAG: class I SAM-dependent methyltransferase [Candidatus Berkelbacteria bacterium]|nr:class I SAM-dependent methyltransferase [Candidatus Berkelbacteria bacterium]